MIINLSLILEDTADSVSEAIAANKDPYTLWPKLFSLIGLPLIIFYLNKEESVLWSIPSATLLGKSKLNDRRLLCKPLGFKR